VVIPLGLDLYMPIPEANPLTVEKIELGRRLFNDRRLSRDGTIACASCHDPARARSILSGDSPYDRFVAGDREALSADTLAGMQLFRGRGNCTACHIGPNFSDEQLHNTGVAWRDGRLIDTGAGHGEFKTPTLREVARTSPYMHDGSLTTLEQVVDYYDRGANDNPWLDPELRALGLSSEDKRALVAFLRALSGHLTEGDLAR
jgi:cytochrome c peroxidase